MRRSAWRRRHGLERNPRDLVRRPVDHRVVRGGVHGLVLLAGLRLAHAVLAVGPGGLHQRGLYPALRRLGHALHQRPIGLGRRARLEDAPELGRRIARLGNEQHTAGVAVEAMHQPRPLTAEAVGHAGQQPIDVTLGAGAALHGQPKRLVEHEHVLVLEQDRPLDQIAVALGEAQRRGNRRLRLGRLAHDRRHAQLLAGLQPGIGLHPLAVDAHLARAQQLLEVGIAHVRKMHAEPAVEAQPRLVALHLDGFDRSVHVGIARTSHSPA